MDSELLGWLKSQPNQSETIRQAIAVFRELHESGILGCLKDNPEQMEMLKEAIALFKELNEDI